MSFSCKKDKDNSSEDGGGVLAPGSSDTQLGPELSELSLAVVSKSFSLQIEISGAKDDRTDPSELQYLLYFSASDSLESVEAAVANGTSYGANGVGDTSYFNYSGAIDLTGLQLNQDYWIALVVVDGDGNSSYLPGQKVQTRRTFESQGTALWSDTLSISSTFTSGAVINGFYVASCSLGPSGKGLGTSLCRYNPQNRKVDYLTPFFHGTTNYSIYLGEINNKHLFGMQVFNQGGEYHLYVTDGTNEGTKVIATGFPNAFQRMQTDAVINGKLALVSYDEIWLTDGTSAGTERLIDLSPPGDFSAVLSTITFGGSLYFGVRGDAATGLWKSDGTTGGTAIFEAIPIANGHELRYFTIYNSKLYFMLQSANNTFELWETDGTSPGTSSIYSFVQTNPDDAVIWGELQGKLLITASTTGAGHEMWLSDGTAPGTTQILDLNAGAGDGVPVNRGFLDGATFYFAGDEGTNGVELWKSDGTGVGTTLIKNINLAGDATPAYFFRSQSGRIFFSADDGSAFELWQTDGTGPGTIEVGDYSAVNSGYFWIGGQVGDHIIAAFTHIDKGYEPRIISDTDLSDFFIDLSSYPKDLIIVQSDEDLVFTADSIGDPSVDFFHSNGSVAASALPNTFPDCDFGRAFTGDGYLYCAAAGVDELRRVNPLLNQISDVKTGFTGQYISEVSKKVDGQDFVLGFTIVPNTFYIYDTDETVPASGNLGSGDFFISFPVPEYLEASSEGLYVRYLNDATQHTSLGYWSANTFTPLKTIGSYNSLNAYPETAMAGDKIVFSNYVDATDGIDLWASDGTVPGTIKIGDTNAGATDNIRFLTSFGSVALFSALGPSGQELYVTDGTLAGTKILKDISDSGSSFPRDLTAAKTKVYFTAYTEEFGYELYVSDGTASETVMVADLTQGPASSFFSTFTTIDDDVVFIKQENHEASSVWISDGTLAGTRKMADLTGVATVLSVHDTTLWIQEGNGIRSFSLDE